LSDIRLVIFDCDGVLVDSEPIINRVHAAVLNEFGFSVTPESLVERFCGMPDAEMLPIIEREHGRLLLEDYGARVAALIARASATELVAIPGVREVIDRLNLPFCVASSGVPDQIRSSLQIVGLLSRFEPNIFSATMLARGKPAPDLFLHAAHSMQTAPAHCLVIEDSVAGVEAAVAAGMPVIGFCGGGHCPADHDAVLRKHGAAVTIQKMEKLPATIAKIAGC
jgi:HAD superfamily hydrolase (TIGR01509 family)